MNRHIVAVLSCAVIVAIGPSAAHAQTTAKKTPRKYDKLLTTVENFAKLNAQIEIREREYDILAPFVQTVIFYADELKPLCDKKCDRSVANYYPRLEKYRDALHEAHRRYQAMTPNITERNAGLMSDIRVTAYMTTPQNKEKAIAELNRQNLENKYHYKAYADTYHSADKAMLSLAATSDLTTIVNSFAATTDRLIRSGRIIPTSPTIRDLKNKVPDIRARIKALEDKRKSIVCTATLSKEWSVEVRCVP